MTDNQQLLDNMFNDKNTPTSTTPDQLILIIDRSGSMIDIKDDAQGGVNQFLAEQKDVPSEANLTLVEFDHEHNKVHDQVNLKSVGKYTLNPRGSTALLDTIGYTLNDQPEFPKGTKVIVVIVTDGQENSSQEYTHSQIQDLIKERREQGWEFLFLAADQDAIQVGTSFGIASNKSVNFTKSSAGTRALVSNMSTYTSSYRIGEVTVDSAVNLNDRQKEFEVEEEKK